MRVRNENRISGLLSSAPSGSRVFRFFFFLRRLHKVENFENICWQHFSGSGDGRTADRGEEGTQRVQGENYEIFPKCSNIFQG